MPISTIRLDDPGLDVFDLGCRTGMLWHRHEMTLAGLGAVERIPVARPGGAMAAQARLADEADVDEVQRPGSGPVAFAAWAFDPTEDDELLVPEVVVVRGPEGRRWMTVRHEPGALDHAVARAREMVADAVAVSWPEGVGGSHLAVESIVAPEEWAGIVGDARDRIRAGALTKVVLAREARVTSDVEFDPGVIVGRLRQTFPTANLFSIDGFVGASPELLVARSADVVRAHPLAGTLPRAADPAVDAGRQAELLASDKNRWEHRITIDWLLERLLPFCSYVDAEPVPSIVSLANVHHLGTLVEGRLSQPSASVLELVEVLHPTPAVGGKPQADALALIGEIERAERGRYGGPTGWLDGRGNGQFAVSVRVAQFDGPTATVFSGVGVVADSDPLDELAETRAKFQALMGAILRP